MIGWMEVSGSKMNPAVESYDRRRRLFTFVFPVVPSGGMQRARRTSGGIYRTWAITGTDTSRTTTNYKPNGRHS